MVKRPRGRPRKLAGSMKPWELGRLAKVSAAFDESRAKDEKYSYAVTHAVNTVKHSNPEMPISETGVKRILSTHRPRGSEIILRFEREPRSEEDISRHRSILEQAAAWHEKMGLTPPPLPVYDETRRREKYLIRFSERPDYPRHNRKAPKE